jgi:hypothetical protein
LRDVITRVATYTEFLALLKIEAPRAAAPVESV